MVLHAMFVNMKRHIGIVSVQYRAEVYNALSI